MSIPLHRRGFDVFLSHAHVDKAFVDEFYKWLTRVCGLDVWYDAKEMASGAAIATGLYAGIENCRALIVVGSEAAFRSGWVRKEINVGQDEQATFPEFRIVPIVIANSIPEPELRGISWLKIPEAKLTLDLAIQTLRALYPPTSVPNPRNCRDVYISASWQANDSSSAIAVCRQLAAEGFRLVGDSKTQQGFSENRIEEIISSCGAMVSIIPFRGQEEMRSDRGCYKYFVKELQAARKLELPTLTFADPKLKAMAGFESDWQNLDTDATEINTENATLIRSLHDLWRPPVLPHYVFLATDLDGDTAYFNSDIRRLIESITGMPTIVGPDIEGENLPRLIIGAIAKSFLIIADISGTGDQDFNLDVSIEAGVAYALKRNLRLIARGETRRPPFMLRSAGQLRTYHTEAEYAGLIRHLCWPFRRRIINREVCSFNLLLDY